MVAFNVVVGGLFDMFTADCQTSSQKTTASECKTEEHYHAERDRVRAWRKKTSHDDKLTMSFASWKFTAQNKELSRQKKMGIKMAERNRKAKASMMRKERENQKKLKNEKISKSMKKFHQNKIVAKKARPEVDKSPAAVPMTPVTQTPTGQCKSLSSNPS